MPGVFITKLKIQLFVFISFCFLHNVESRVVGNDLGDCIQKLVAEIQITEPHVDATVVNFKASSQTDNILKNINNVRYIIRSFLWIQNPFRNSLYIIYGDDVDVLATGIKSMKKDYYWNPRANFIIILQDLSIQLDMLSNQLFEENIFNVSVLNKVDNDYEIFTFDGKLDACGRPDIKTLEYVTRCSKLTGQTNIFNIKKPKNFRGCHVKMVSHHFWPFVNLNKIENKDPGITDMTLQMWNKYAGVTAELVKFEKDNFFGRVTRNYTYTGMLSWVEQKKLDGAIGGYTVTFDRTRALDYSYPYTVDHGIAIVARAGMLTSWRAVLLQYNSYSVAIISGFLVFFCYAAVKYSIFSKNKKEMSYGILIVFGYVCSNMRNSHVRKNDSLRLIVCSLLIFVFFISFLNQAYLSSATTTPIRRHQIQTLQETFKECKPLIGWTWNTVFGINKTVDCVSVMDCLRKVKDEKKKLYTVLTQISYTTYSFKLLDQFGEIQVYPIMQPIVNMCRGTYFRRGSPFLDSYSKLIERCTESGVAAQYYKSLIYRDRIKYLIEFLRQNQDPNPEPLMELFVVLLIGYALSLLVFIYECRTKIRSYYNRALHVRTP
ncbi:unnamed protein product [Chilo suppressalis]|uniref:Solute-binding protein family 3/N-terminal domain-containing protein n=1 Tax=Chilo suppressalis TaxID=168631 RepID=A0ABN8B1Z1_CHISP|nr:unnamed protein product [Chilo suppressalis]